MRLSKGIFSATISSLAALLSCPTAAQEDEPTLTDGIYAVFDTSLGEFTAELDYQLAPISCASFVGLAEGSTNVWDDASGAAVNFPFFDGLIFHAVEDGFYIQSGDPNGDDPLNEDINHGPGYAFPDEASPYIGHDIAGTLSMANSGPNTNGSQFFITLDAANDLDGLHNAFGTIVSGMETVQAIGAVDVDENNQPTTDVSINTVTILRIGEDAEAFNPSLHLFPTSYPADIDLLYLRGTGPVLRVNAEEKSRYVVASAIDLVDWQDSAYLAGDFEAAKTHDLLFTEDITSENPKKFLNVSEIQGHVSLDASGAELVITTQTSGDPYIETIDFSSGFKGLYSLPEDSWIIEYRWYEISQNRTQVEIEFIDTNATTPIIQYYLDWTDGTVYIRDATPDVIEEGDPDNWVLEGTFTFVTPD
ncbi:peptidyl-prolyl cis-trans isomerase, cyclophilin-type domain protein [Verrucomicrobiia bacterium DG1235]|nr:peptidyl-prolyl cis-trans isomerase, cyclophilin-type domain protein [Verrucomicrobiae bacterium DG1235]